jgi:hypothetical protein
MMSIKYSSVSTILLQPSGIIIPTKENRRGVQERSSLYRDGLYTYPSFLDTKRELVPLSHTLDTFLWMRSCREVKAAGVKVATVPGSIPASSDTSVSEEWQRSSVILKNKEAILSGKKHSQFNILPLFQLPSAVAQRQKMIIYLPSRLGLYTF